MLSICIPVYNVDVTKLVYDLLVQGKENNLTIEILVFDDQSEESYKLLNRHIAQKENVVYFELEKNIGRAAIRNLMAQQSSHPNLLFIDSDSDINTNYIKNYKSILNKYAIVCGGRVHPESLPSPLVSLRWTFGRQREDYDAFTRTQKLNTGFISNNFLIKKRVFKQVRFDEEIKQYGHEDTMIGIKFEKLGIRTKHIDNPVTHTGLEENDVFIRKTKVSINTLLFLYLKNKNESLMYRHIKLLKYFRVIKHLKLLGVLNYFYNHFENKILRNLHSECPNIKLFDLYKLCYFSAIYLKHLK